MEPLIKFKNLTFERPEGRILNFAEDKEGRILISRYIEYDHYEFQLYEKSYDYPGYYVLLDRIMVRLRYYNGLIYFDGTFVAWTDSIGGHICTITYSDKEVTYTFEEKDVFGLWCEKSKFALKEIKLDPSIPFTFDEYSVQQMRFDGEGNILILTYLREDGQEIWKCRINEGILSGDIFHVFNSADIEDFLITDNELFIVYKDRISSWTGEYEKILSSLDSGTYYSAIMMDNYLYFAFKTEGNLHNGQKYGHSRLCRMRLGDSKFEQIDKNFCIFDHYTPHNLRCIDGRLGYFNDDEEIIYVEKVKPVKAVNF